MKTLSACLLFAVAANTFAQDSFEPDDTPLTASEYPRFDASVNLDPQSHTLTVGDEDWIYWELASNTSCSSGNFPFQVTVTSSTPGFRPIIETYPAERLSDPSVAPTDVRGSCDAEQPLGTVFEFPIDPLVRIRQCPTQPHLAEYTYDFEPVPDLSFVCAPLASVRGRVVEAGSGAAVPGVFILSSDNVATVSDPSDGSYQIVVLRTTQSTDVVENFSLAVVSEGFLGGTATIDQIQGQSTVDQDLVVVTILFADGFE